MKTLYRSPIRFYGFLLLMGVMALALSLTARAQSAIPFVYWQRILDLTAAPDPTVSLARSADGGCAIVFTASTSSITKLSAEGTVEWTTPLYSNSVNGYYLQAMSDGGFLVLESLGGDPMLLERIGPAGTVIYRKYLDLQGLPTSRSYTYSASGLIATPDGGFLVSGIQSIASMLNPDNFSNILLLKLDKDGNTTWVKRYLGDGSTSLTGLPGVSVASEGGYLVHSTTTAKSITGSTDKNFSVIYNFRVDEQGTIVWQRIGSPSATFFDFASTADGYVATGTYTGLSGLTVLKLNRNLDVIKATRLADTYPENASYRTSIKPTPDGGCIVVDSYAGNGRDYRITKFNSELNIDWQEKGGGRGDDYARKVIVNPDGTYFISGTTNSPDFPGRTDNSTNTVIWVRKQAAKANTQALTLIAPTYDCTTGAITFNTTGGDGSTITYFAPGITGPTTNPNQFVDSGLRQAADAKPLTLSATQSGVTVTYVFALRAVCPIGTNPPVQTNTDRAILVDLYNSTKGPIWVNKTNWLQGDSPCNWFGVSCNGNGRVIKLSLGSNNLTGTLPASLGNLSQLESLILQRNELSGSIPANLGSLSSLTHLFLNNNQLSGNMPASLGNLSKVAYFQLEANQLTGSIPANLGNLSQVLSLGLNDNQLTGEIPAELGNLQNLTSLNLNDNQLSGPIPASLGSLSKVLVLYLSVNKLSGSIPASLGSLSQIQYINFSGNRLTGSIPASLGNLSQIKSLFLINNFLSGCFPAELASLCGKDVLLLGNPGLPGGGDFASFCNNRTGACTSTPTPGNLALTAPTYDCTTGAFTFNTTGGDGSTITYFAPGITGPTTNPNQFVDAGLRQAADAQPLTLSATQSGVTVTYRFDLRATCPIGTNPPVQSNPDQAILVDLYNSTNGPGWTNKTNWLQSDSPCGWFGVKCDGTGRVTELSLSGNNLNGTLPASLGNLLQLTYLSLGQNQLSGSIPATLGNLSQLKSLYLYTNQLSGPIPASLGNLSQLTYLTLQTNRLTGIVPVSLGNLANVQYLLLDNNLLNGPIPVSLSNLSQVMYLTLSNNQLSGNIPGELSNLPKLISLILFGNQLSGSIPTSLGNLTQLEALQLQRNQLSGPIPASLGNLTQMQFLFLDHNQLSGSVPASLGKLSQVISLNFSDNQLSGCFPTELTSLCGKSVLMTGNPGLPGGGDFASFCSNRTGACPVTPTTGLSLTAPTYNCATGAITFNTTGGNGTLIEYQAPGITGWTTNPNQFVDQASRTASDVQPFTLMARQSGTVVTYTWNLKQACGRARVAAEEAGTTLSLQLLGNPVHESVQVLIKGAEGQPVQLRLTDVRGRLLESRAIEQAGAEEMQQFKLDPSAGPGMLFLQATKQQQTRTVKIIRQ